MRRRRLLRLSRRRVGLLALLLVVSALAWPMQGTAWNQGSHYALVKALSRGTPYVDRTRFEVGEVGTGDVRAFEGHVYSNKAPGLAFLAVPAYVVLEAAGMRTTGDPTRMEWALGLWAIVLPAGIMLLLFRRLADGLEPGFGTAAAVTLGLGTLVTAYATLFFSHLLAAVLLFGCFGLLWLERQRGSRIGIVAGAGVLAGLSVTTEYPSVLGAAVLGLYAIARTGVVRRALAYGAGVLAGIAPLLLYQWWAFGSIRHVSYGGAPITGQAGAERSVWFEVPSPSRLVQLLFHTNGLLPLAPVLACGVLGTVLLFRRGRRAEALLISGFVLAYVLFNMSYTDSYTQAGLRLLVVVLPFLALPLALAYRTAPATTAALALVSVFVMTVITATRPLAAYEGTWPERLASRDFALTAASLVGITGWYSIVPYFLAALAAVACAVAVSPRVRLSTADVVLAAAALAAWAAIAVAAPNDYGRGLDGGFVLGTALVVGALLLAAAGLQGGRPLVRRKPKPASTAVA